MIATANYQPQSDVNTINDIILNPHIFMIPQNIFWLSQNHACFFWGADMFFTSEDPQRNELGMCRTTLASLDNFTIHETLHKLIWPLMCHNFQSILWQSYSE